MVCATSKGSDRPVQIRSLIRAFASRLHIQLLTDHHLEFLSLKGGCTGSYESTLVRMPHCWKSHVAAQIFFVSSVNVDVIVGPCDNTFPCDDTLNKLGIRSMIGRFV